MNIAIIGAGNVGGTLSRKWAAAKHTVTIGARDTTASKTRALVGPYISVATIRESVESAEVILIAATPEAIRSIVEAMGNVHDRIIIDAMNSVRSKAGEFASTAEALRVWTGSQNVVKCFNSTGFNIMANPNFNNTAADMFMAGNSTRGKSVARTLAIDAGFAECYDFGGDDRIPLLEQFALSWINLAMMQGYGREIAFKLMKR